MEDKRHALNGEEKSKDVDGYHVRLFYANIVGKWNVDVVNWSNNHGDKDIFLIDEYFLHYHEACKLYYNIEPRIFLALAQR